MQSSVQLELIIQREPVAAAFVPDHLMVLVTLFTVRLPQNKQLKYCAGFGDDCEQGSQTLPR